MEQFSKRDVKVYTVWVGGMEVSPELFNIQQAMDIADDWKRIGYDDVQIGSYYRREQQTYEQTYASFKPFRYSY